MTLRGIVAPALTPFDARYEIDVPRFVAHCRALLEQGCIALAPFGTTSEANSLGLQERETLLEALLEAGIPPQQLIPGVGCCALPDTVRLAKHASKCLGVLTLPPFYYKGPSNEGLYRYYAQLIERTGARVFLYHIPQFTNVPLPVELVTKLHMSYPQNIVGLKDSGGDFDYTRRLLAAVPQMTIFSGSEKFLSANLALGGAGCITATANVNATMLARVAREPTPEGQAEIDKVRAGYDALPLIPALKATLARSDPAWRTVRPPLVELAE
jgi:4-hydroxy-tetrahydrodipicolinate synthase